MKNVLIAVDDTKGSKAALKTFIDLFNGMRPETVVLLHVEALGKSILDERMGGDSELSTLAEALKGTEFQEMLDKKAKSILEADEKFLRDNGVTGIKPIVKFGHPAEEILKTAKEEGAKMIVIGSRGKRMHTVLLGSVSREVSNNADIPVLVAR